MHNNGIDGRAFSPKCILDPVTEEIASEEFGPRSCVIGHHRTCGVWVHRRILLALRMPILHGLCDQGIFVCMVGQCGAPWPMFCVTVAAGITMPDLVHVSKFVWPKPAKLENLSVGPDIAQAFVCIFYIVGLVHVAVYPVTLFCKRPKNQMFQGCGSQNILANAKTARAQLSRSSL